MANLILGYNNLIDSATLSGGSWHASYPLANLKSRVLAKKARSNNDLAASTVINVDLGIARKVQAFGAIASNLSATNATIRLRGSNDSSFASSAYDSGLLATTVQTPDVTLAWDTPVTVRYWRLEIADTLNTSGYLEIGRLFLGQALRAGDNYSKGAELGYQSRSTVVTSLGGVEYFDRVNNRRTFNFVFDWLTAPEAYQTVLEVQKLADITEEVLLLADHEDNSYRQQRHFLGRLSQLSPIKAPYLTVHQAGFEVVEIV